MRCHFLIFLRNVITEAIDVVLEDEVVDLASVARLGSGYAAIFEARALQVHEVMLVLLEVPIEGIDEHLLILTDFILVEKSTALRTKKDHIPVCRLSLVLLLLIIVGERLVARLEVVWIQLLVRHQLEHLAGLLRRE